MDYKLIIFDLDNTLAPYGSDSLYPDAEQWLNQNSNVAVAIATNQGGVGLRFWMEQGDFGEPGKYPTLEDVDYRLRRLFDHLNCAPIIFACYRYQSKKGTWCPVPEGSEFISGWQKDWRKPDCGMLTAAMTVKGVQPDETLMVGDSPEDQEAAMNAGCAFQWAWDFFNRPMPEKIAEE